MKTEMLAYGFDVVRAVAAMGTRLIGQRPLPSRIVKSANTLRPRHVPGEGHPVFTGFFCKLTPRIAPVS